jgi:beta-glucanase (GH16 family)
LLALEGAIIMAAAAPADAEPAAARNVPAGYELVWADEFDTDGLPDPARWSFDTDYNGSGWHNRERQYYSADRPQNVRVEDGRLIIEAHREELRDRPDWSGQRYSSARLVTRGRAAWTYGYFEVRAKLPCARGTWPAFWMLPADRTPDFEHGEIDIVEHVGHDAGRIRHSLHTGSRNHRRGNHLTASVRLRSACNAFHTYHLHWTPDRIVMGVDGVDGFEERHRVNSDWPFDQPFYLILNLAIGGTLGGARGIDERALPARLEVGYVRVYGRPGT